MKQGEKTVVIDELRSLLAGAKAAMLADHRGLKVSELIEQRRQQEKYIVDRHSSRVMGHDCDWPDPWQDYRRGVLYRMINMLENAQLLPGATPWIVIPRYVAAAVELEVGELII